MGNIRLQAEADQYVQGINVGDGYQGLGAKLIEARAMLEQRRPDLESRHVFEGAPGIRSAASLRRPHQSRFFSLASCSERADAGRSRA